MESGHGLPVAESRQVVIGEHSEDRRAKTNRPQNLRSRSRKFLRVFFAHEVFVREMHEQRNTGIDCRHHRLGTYSMDLHHHAGLLAFVHDRPQESPIPFRLARVQESERSLP